MEKQVSKQEDVLVKAAMKYKLNESSNWKIAYEKIKPEIPERVV